MINFLFESISSGEDVVLGRVSRVLLLDESTENSEDNPAGDVTNVSPISTKLFESGVSLTEGWEATKI